MALKVFDGFDHYAAQADLQARVGVLQWTDVSVGSPITFSTGRGGVGQCANIATGLYGFLFGGSFNQNFGACIPAIAMIVTSGGASTAIVEFQAMDYTANAPQITVRCYLASGTVIAYLGDSVNNVVIAESPPNAFSAFVWQKYELKIVVGSSGSFDFHVNGNSVLSATGVNTQATANAWTNGFRLRGGLVGGDGGPNISVDDFNLNDLTTGPGTYPLNSFIGDCATRTLFTASNASVSWTPLTGANWQEVGETQFDGDTSYNYTSTGGNKDSFNFQSLPADVTAIFGVQVTGAYRKLDASAQTITQGVSSSGTYSGGANWPMSLDYSYFTDLWPVSPATSATWTPTQVNAIQASYELNN